MSGRWAISIVTSEMDFNLAVRRVDEVQEYFFQDMMRWAG